MSAPTPWQSGTAHSVGDVVQAFTDPGTGFFFRCVVAGTTGSTEPFWPSFIGNETVDGTVTWKAVSIISGDFQAPDPSAIIELFELQLFANIHGVNDIYRFHAGTNLVNNGEVVWKGNPYLRFPVEADGFEYTGQGTLPRPKIRISNILGSITAILLSLPNGLEAAKVTRIRTLGRYLDAANFPVSGDILLTEDDDALLLEDDGSILVEPINATEDFSAEFPREIYYIDRKSAENRELVEFELASIFDLAGVRAPKRQCIANICQWVYRSAECGYSAAVYYDANNNAVGSASLDVCGKRLSSCQARFEPFTLTGAVTVGSPTITLTSTLSILPNDAVRGFGLPSGTVVSSVVNSTTVQVNNNATATNNVTVTGTPSATSSTMTVTSATGLGVGMTVTGPYMNGQTIIGISGTTLTLSERPYSFRRDGTYDILSGNDAIKLADTSSIVTGMRVFGSFNINTTVASVTTNTRIRIDSNPIPVPEEGANVTVYFMPASPAAASYNFAGGTSYSFRNLDSAVPYGSFPGIGSAAAS